MRWTRSRAGVVPTSERPATRIWTTRPAGSTRFDFLARARTAGGGGPGRVTSSAGAERPIEPLQPVDGLGAARQAAVVTAGEVQLRCRVRERQHDSDGADQVEDRPAHDRARKPGPDATLGAGPLLEHRAGDEAEA